MDTVDRNTQEEPEQGIDSVTELPMPSEEGTQIPATQIPTPESVSGWSSLPSLPPTWGTEEWTVMALIGRIWPVSGFLNRLKTIPPCLWVVNQWTEDITVVVSKYGPDRLFAGGGVNASATGAAINFNATTFQSPATTKVLAADSNIPAVFPLWSHSNGFGVLSIFTGATKTLCIENDRVPAGATAYFEDKPNLRMVDYCGRLIDQRSPFMIRLPPPPIGTVSQPTNASPSA